MGCNINFYTRKWIEITDTIYRLSTKMILNSIFIDVTTIKRCRVLPNGSSRIKRNVNRAQIDIPLYSDPMNERSALQVILSKKQEDNL